MTDTALPAAPADEITLHDDKSFTAETSRLIEEAEQKRLQKMRQHRDRMMINTCATLALMCIGSGFFGWFFLVSGDLALALLCLICTIIPPVFTQSWAHEPIRKYREEYKSEFMPAMAKALGGLKFYPKRGISRKILSRTGTVPAHKDYNAEDFFIGRYHGVKMMMSEARLTHPKKSGELVFDGIFVLIEAEHALFEGHTVLTADQNLAARLSKKLAATPITNNEYKRMFTALSSKPDAAQEILSDALLKEFAEMHELFKKSPLSATFFQKKYVFVQIPYDEDMFEASNIFIPVTTNDAALRCKREIEQILSIIDILNHIGDGQKQAAPKVAGANPLPSTDEDNNTSGS